MRLTPADLRSIANDLDAINNLSHVAGSTVLTSIETVLAVTLKSSRLAITLIVNRLVFTRAGNRLDYCEAGPNESRPWLRTSDATIR